MLLGRYFNAFLTPAAMFCGMGLYELLSSLQFMLLRVRQWKTPLIRLGFATWLFMLVYLSFYIMFVDWRISYYPVSDAWYRQRFICLLVSGGLASVSLWSMMLLRIRMFFSSRSTVFVAVALLGAATIIFTLLFAIAATYLTIIGQGGVTTATKGDVLADKCISLLAALSHVSQAFFSTVCSLTFLRAVSRSVGLSSTAFISDMFAKYEGMRFCMIILVCLFTTSCQIYNAIIGPNNYIVYVSYYTDAWLFPLELYTFLTTSFVSAKSIVVEHGKGVNAQQVGDIAVRRPEPNLSKRDCLPSPRDSPAASHNINLLQTDVHRSFVDPIETFGHPQGIDVTPYGRGSPQSTDSSATDIVEPPQSRSNALYYEQPNRHILGQDVNLMSVDSQQDWVFSSYR